MSVFAIADLHLSIGTDKPMDIFAGWGNHTARLEEHWRRLVGDGDTVVLPGDFCWAMTLDEARPDFAFLDALPGRKILLKGNHDYWWCTQKKMTEWLDDNQFSSIQILFNNAYCADGIGICGTRGWNLEPGEPESEKVFARELGRLRMSVAALEKQTCGERVAFLHYPPVYRDYYAEAVIEILCGAGVRRCYYGHLHGNALGYAFNGQYRGIQFQLISADSLRFEPLLIHK